MEEFDPISRIEFFLDAVLNGDPAPYDPQTRAEFYLAYLCGSAVTLPTPQSRVDFYLAYKCGEDVEIPDPIERIDFYLAKWCGMDVETPDPIHPIEYYMDALANNGGVKTVTGNPISVSDALAKPAESLTIEILPQQSGSGDPSPDNIRPISGWTEAKVWRTGKNLFDINLLNVSPVSVSDGVATGTGNNFYTTFRNGVPGLTIPNAQLTLSVEAYTTGSVGTSGNGLFLRVYYTDGTNDTIYFGNDTSSYTKKTLTTNSAKTVSAIGISAATNGGNTWWIRNIQLELGSTATAYEPYQGNLYTIDLDGTVYGGELDVTTGVLTVDRVKESYNWSNGIGATVLGNHTRKVFKITHASAVSAEKPQMCTVAPYIKNYTADSVHFYVDAASADTYSAVVFLPNDVTEQSFDVVYELATPLTIQLTPTEIEMLLGENTVWSENGDITLTYMADGNANDVEALQILLNNRYVNNGAEDEATDREALDILLGGR